MGSEIEFEHGGTESAIEVEDEEAGEFEKRNRTWGVKWLWSSSGFRNLFARASISAQGTSSCR